MQDRDVASVPSAARKPGWTRRIWHVILTIVCLVGPVVVWDGARRAPTGPADGTGANGLISHPADSPTIRVATFNIDGGKGRNGHYDLNRTAELIRHCDLIALNEVHGHAFRATGDQAQALGQDLGLAWLFAPTERRWWRDDFGNGLLTSLPIGYWQRLPLSALGAPTNRNVLLVKVPYEGCIVNVLITHIGRHEQRERELRAAIELFLSLDEPAIMMGDLNTTAEDPQIKRLQATPGVTDALSLLPASKRSSHVDWIFFRGLRATNAGVEDNGASDHPLYWADMALAPAALPEALGAAKVAGRNTAPVSVPSPASWR